MSNPFDTPDLWDYVVLGGDQSPGIAEVRGLTRKLIWDDQKPSGNSGASTVYKGDELIKFSVLFTAIEGDEYDAWEAWAQKHLRGPAGSTAQDFSHPDGQQAGVSSVVLEEEPQWSQTGPGLFTKEVKFKQYRKPKPAEKKVSGSAGSTSGSGAAEGTAQDEYDRMIEDLTQQVKDLAA